MVDRLAVVVVARRVLDVHEDGVVLGRPAPLRAGAVVVGPDDLVEEALAAEQLVEQRSPSRGNARVARRVATIRAGEMTAEVGSAGPQAPQDHLALLIAHDHRA